MPGLARGLPAAERPRRVCPAAAPSQDRVTAGCARYFDVGLIVAENPQGFGKPRYLMPGQKSQKRKIPWRPGRSPGRFASHLNLRQRQARMVRKARPAGAIRFRADRVSNNWAPTSNSRSRICRSETAGPCEAALGRQCEASFLSHRNEIAQMTQLHAQTMLSRYDMDSTKSFSSR